MSETIKAGTYVQIHKVVLLPEERTGKIPQDTKKVPFEMWTKGFLDKDAKIGESVAITTVTGRGETGELVEANPIYSYGFGGRFVPQLPRIGMQLRAIAREDK